MYQTDAYSATVQPSDEKSTLQKEVEDNEDILFVFPSGPRSRRGVVDNSLALCPYVLSSILGSYMSLIHGPVSI